MHHEKSLWYKSKIRDKYRYDITEYSSSNKRISILTYTAYDRTQQGILSMY